MRAGELLAVLGPNGAGKSTAISLWLGLTEADSGEVTVARRLTAGHRRRRGLGVMMQEVEMPKELRVRELVRAGFQLLLRPMPVEETLRRAGVAALADRPYGKLSGGQKRLAQFASGHLRPAARAVPRRAQRWPGRPGARNAVEQHSQPA